MHQFALLYYVGVKEFSNLENYVNSGNVYTVQQMQYLEDKGLLTLIIPDVYKLSNIVVAGSFLKEVIVDIEYVSEELRTAYPHNIIVNNNVYPARNIGGVKLEMLYKKILNNDIDLHNDIIKAINKWSIKLPTYNGKKVAPVGLEKFLESRFFETLIDSDNGENDTTYDYK